ncbi:5629_t:CDS:1 [Acaulospora morrowiae]|uniref:5629_t:CDS:1 n=1 Tax=Acaulospora morrowiae TaxID=94023 RepID=A0A9N9ASX9_9GLOM|nr:5629_t:CDS:1 [Acaulospora morrowiae]
MKFGVILALCMMLATTSLALPYARRATTTLTINPFLFDVAPPTPNDNSAASLKDVCDSLSATLNKTLADCQDKNKGTDACNKPNGTPINEDAVAKHAKQCEAHTFVKGAYSPDIFGNKLLSIDQNGNTFTVGSETFQTLSDAVVGACKEQRQRNLATLDDCTNNPDNADKCKKLDGTQVSREEVNLHNSVCFSFHAK